MVKIVDLPLCTGCSACYSVCSKSAILMKEDKEGFLFPQIDTVKCVDCKKCENVCPILHPLEPETSKKEAYAFINNDEHVRRASSSGGVFSALTQKLFEDRKDEVYVFGAEYCADFKSIVHSFVDNYNDIEKFRGSKYVQSNIGDCFKDCKKLLDDGKTVCFSGTPCQIGGLKSFLHKKYDNLFTIDIICHGVPSPLLWKKYVECREKNNGTKTTSTSFRRKNNGWKKFSLWFSFTNHKEYCQDLTKDPYLRLFLKNVCLRRSCYDCKFKTIDRQSDITMADFWGIQHEYPELDDDKGVSFVIVHSEQGKALFDSVENCEKKSVPMEIGLKYNPSMVSSVEITEKRETFFRDLNALNLEKVIRKYANTPFSVKACKLFRQCVGKALRKIRLKR